MKHIYAAPTGEKVGELIVLDAEPFQIVDRTWIWIGCCKRNNPIPLVIGIRKIWDRRGEFAALDLYGRDHAHVLAPILGIGGWMEEDGYYCECRGMGPEMDLRLGGEPCTIAYLALFWLMRRIVRLEFPSICEFCPDVGACDIHVRALDRCVYNP